MKHLAKVACLSGIFAAGSLATRSAEADVITLTDSQDAMIFGTSASVDTGNAAGAAPAFFAGADGAGNIKRSLLEFNLATIPSDATITGVTLTLHLAQVAGSAGSSNTVTNTKDRIFGLYANQQAWTEGPSGATTSAGVGGSGQGSPRQNGDVTWDYASFNTNPALAILWNNGTQNLHGGNVSSTQSAQLDVPIGAQLAIGDAFAFSSAGMIADVQGWVDGAEANDGWLLKSENLEATTQSFLGFWSKEAAGEGNDPSVAIAPALTVTFTEAPEPASLTLLAIGAPMLLARRRTNLRKDAE